MKIQRFSRLHNLLCITLLGSFLISCSPSPSNPSSGSKPVFVSNTNTAKATSQYRLQEKAPEFSLKDLTGKTVSLSSFEGKFVVIHFATTWCPFCNAEAQHLEKLYQDYQSKGVEVLIIDVKEPASLIQKKLKNRFNLSFPILLDDDGAVAASYAPEEVLPELARDEVALASNILIDPQGNIQFFSLLDTQNFDAELIALKTRLNELL